MSQIATKIREKSVNLIFAVTEEQLNIYNKLSKYIEGSEATKLANDSSNIVTVIKNNYQVQFYCNFSKFGLIGDGKQCRPRSDCS